MQLGVCKRMHAPLAAARAWPLWELPRWLTGYIVAIVVAYLAVLSVVGQFYTLSPRQIVILGALILCGAATVELTKRSGENAGLISDIYGSGTSYRNPAAPGLRDAGAGHPAYPHPVAGPAYPSAPPRLHRGHHRAVLCGRRGAVPRALPYWVRVGTQPLGHPTAWILAIAAAALMSGS